MNPLSGQDDYEQFVELFMRHENDLRTFVRSLMPTWHDADEVIQQVALVAWRKFKEFDPETQFIKWLCVIARFESLSYKRKMARDRLVFSEDLMSLLADEAMEETEERANESQALEGCLRKLPPQQRELVTRAYTQGFSTKEFADKAGAKPGSFYMRLNRIRRTLLECIQSTLEKEGASA